MKYFSYLIFCFAFLPHGANAYVIEGELKKEFNQTKQEDMNLYLGKKRQEGEVALAYFKAKLNEIIDSRIKIVDEDLSIEKMEVEAEEYYSRSDWAVVNLEKMVKIQSAKLGTRNCQFKTALRKDVFVWRYDKDQNKIFEFSVSCLLAPGQPSIYKQITVYQQLNIEVGSFEKEEIIKALTALWLMK